MERYTGIYRFGDEIYKNMYPQIIEKELYERVKEKAAKLRYGRHSLKVSYLLSRKLFCGYCGKPINGEYGTSKSGKQVFYYKCSGIKRLHNGCQKTVTPKEALENFIIEQVLAELNKPEIITKLVDHLMELQSNLENDNATLKILERERRQAQTSLDNLLKAVEQGIINQTTNNRMQELEEQLATIEKQIIIEKSKTQTQIPREQIERYYQDALRHKSKQLINALIKEIQLYNDKIKITFNSPLKSSPDDNQGCFHITELKFKIASQYINKSQTITTQYLVL